MSQSSFDLGLGYCLYSNNYNDYKRIDGVTLNFGYEYSFNDIFSLRAGLDANFSRENYYEFYYDVRLDMETGDFIYDFTTIITSKTNGYSMNL